jgi:lysyl endopeptidase
MDVRIAPPDFQPLSGPYCSMPNASIPDNDSGAAVDTITVTDTGTLSDLDVAVQIEHTWIGDLRGVLTHAGGCTVQLWHRIDLDGDTCCGCLGDDMDVTLDDAAAVSIEDSCGTGPSGGAQGTFRPGDPVDFPADVLANCNGEDISGDWTITVTDGAGGDLGTLIQWCLIETTGGGDGGGDGGGVPATTGIGLVLLVLAVGGGSAYFLRRK